MQGVGGWVLAIQGGQKGGGGIQMPQSTPHMHVLAGINSNVQQLDDTPLQDWRNHHSNYRSLCVQGDTLCTIKMKHKAFVCHNPAHIYNPCKIGGAGAGP